MGDVARQQSWWSALYAWFASVMPEHEKEHGSNKFSRWLPVLGLLTVIAAFIIVETMQPVYFVQDDNFAQFLPAIVNAGRELFDHHHILNFNPHQYLGAPMLDNGTYALTYPVTYLSYGIARFLLHDEFLTLEIFALLHLIAGFLTMYLLGRSLSLRREFAVAASLCFTLSGFVLIAGRSWYYLLPTVAFAPLLIMLALKLRDEHVRVSSWIAITAFAIGAYFHSGNAQFWSYAMIFFSLTCACLFIAGSTQPRRIWLALSGVLAGLAIAAILLVPQFIFVENVVRPSGGNGIGDTWQSFGANVVAMICPYPFSHAVHPAGWGFFVNGEFMTSFYYNGTIPLLATLCSIPLFLFALCTRHWRKAINRDVMLICAIVAFLFALGSAGLLWTILAKFPGFDKFQHPFKFLIFVNLFVSIAGFVWLSRMAAGRWRKLRWLPTAVLAFVIIVMLYNSAMARPAFWMYGERPYDDLPHEMLSLTAPDVRVHPIGDLRSTATQYSRTLLHNFPSILGGYSTTGYDALIQGSPEFDVIYQQLQKHDTAVLVEYGVRYVIIFQNGQLSAGELNATKPIVSIGGAAVPFVYTNDGLEIDPAGASGDVTVAMTAWKSLLVEVDGETMPWRADAMGRLHFTLPPGAKQVIVRYDPHFRYGFAACVFLALLAAGSLVAFRKAERTVKKAEEASNLKKGKSPETIPKSPRQHSKKPNRNL